jgi:hypothetical protein
MSAGASRCAWVDATEPESVADPDRKRGVAHHDDRALFELLVVVGAQAGLSWYTAPSMRTVGARTSISRSMRSRRSGGPGSRVCCTMPVSSGVAE